jgi:acyltransferase
MEKRRIKWLDSAKGLGILAVVLGHVSFKNRVIKKYIFSFHMPLFFMISGYLFNKESYGSYTAFLKKKIKTLIIPYFIFSFGSYFYWFLTERFYRPAETEISIFKPLIGIFYSNGVDDYLVHNTVLWFITCLFVVENIFFFINKIKHKSGIFLALFFFSLVGYIDSLIMPFRLPWGIDIAFTAVVFYGIGYLLKTNKNSILSILEKKNKYLIGATLLFCSIIFCFINGSVDMNFNVYGNYVFFYFSAICGSAFCFMLCKSFEDLKLLSFLGKNSLMIMVLHEPVKRALLGVLVYGFHMPYDLLRSSLIFGIVITAIVIALILSAVVLWNKSLCLLKGWKLIKKKTYIPILIRLLNVLHFSIIHKE